MLHCIPIYVSVDWGGCWPLSGCRIEKEVVGKVMASYSVLHHIFLFHPAVCWGTEGPLVRLSCWRLQHLGSPFPRGEVHRCGLLAEILSHVWWQIPVMLKQLAVGDARLTMLQPRSVLRAEGSLSFPVITLGGTRACEQLYPIRSPTSCSGRGGMSLAMLLRYFQFLAVLFVGMWAGSSGMVSLVYAEGMSMVTFDAYPLTRRPMTFSHVMLDSFVSLLWSWAWWVEPVH